MRHSLDIASRLFVHVNAADVDSVLLREVGSADTGLIVWGGGLSEVRQIRPAYGGPTGHDAGLWRSTLATPAQPLPGLGDSQELALFSTSLDQYASPIAGAGADFVLTPSGFVQAGEWATLRALLVAAACTDRQDVLTLVPTDAQMLDQVYLDRFLDELCTADRPLGLIFAGSTQPFAQPGRICALRTLMAALPGLAILATEYHLAADIIARGGSSSVGFDRALRRPIPPGSRNGNGMAKGWLPGLFLRALWETRGPSVYADWYASRPSSPHCVACGRDIDDFEATTEDRLLIKRHNVHTLMTLIRDLRAALDPVALLESERLAALRRHLELHPFSASHQTDPVLRRLVELDDGRGRLVLPSGAWSR